MRVFIRILSFFIAIMFVSSCQRDLDIIVPDNNNIGQIFNPTPVQASVQGKVIDENDNAVAGALVRAGTSTTTSDNRGLFSFKNIQLDKYASVVSVENAGYFKGIRTFSAAAGSSNFIKLKLIPKSLAGSVNAANGGEVSLSNGSGISFSANSFITKSTGQPYTGSVNVFAATIDPTSTDISVIVPGSFQATDANNLRVILKSFGMAAVQLESPSGEILQIATGKTAKLRLTIPAALTSSAPATIPLWSLNETDGLWKQEGEAVKTGNYYEGDVSHFSFWNCDIGNNSIFLELTLNAAGAPLPNTIVKISRLNNPSATYGYTDSSGYVGGLVFSNEPLLLEVVNSCYETVHSQTIGPYSQNASLGTINVTIPTPTALTITGNAVDCNNQPVTNGNAFIYFEGQLYTSLITNGNFSTTITRCSSGNASVEIVAEDNVTMQQSSTWNGIASMGIINTGTLTACGSSTQQYINYTINGTSYSYLPPSDSVGQYNIGGTTMTVFFGSDSSSTLNMGINNPIGPGTGQQLQFLNSTYIDSSSTIVNSIPVSITEYGNIGEFISANFSGVLMGSPPGNTTYNVSVSFRIRRIY